MMERFALFLNHKIELIHKSNGSLVGSRCPTFFFIKLKKYTKLTRLNDTFFVDSSLNLHKKKQSPSFFELFLV
jgi:hypothetical protein